MNFLSDKSKSKSQHRVAEWISVVIVPEGGVPRRYKIRIFWLKMAGIGAGLFAVVILLAVLSYSTVLRKSLERDSLLSENARLLNENQRVARLVKDVEASRQSLARIVHSLGGKLDLSESTMQDSL